MRSRMYARVLMGAGIFAVGAMVWTDPDMREDVTAKAEELRPVAAGYLVGTPLEDLLGPAIAEDAAATEEQLADAAGLPNSSLPVNRP